MKKMLVIWMLMSLPWLCLAQSAPVDADKDTREALKDAEYAVRRFDEVTARIDFSRWRAPGTTVGRIEDALKVVRANYTEEAERVLAKLDGGGKPTTTDLLLVMYDVQMASTELYQLGDDALSWGSGSEVDLASELTEGGVTAITAAAKVFVVLKQQTEREEESLKACRHTSPGQKKKPTESK